MEPSSAFTIFWIIVGYFMPVLLFGAVWLFITGLRWLIYRNDPKPAASTGAINGPEQAHLPGSRG